MHLTRSDELTYWPAFLDLCALTAPRAIASEPPHRWDWKAIVRLASEHLITPAVWPAIEGRACVPSEVKAYFRITHEMNAERNAVILNALAEALSLLHEIGIKPIC